MADDPTPDPEVKPAEVTEDDLRNLIGEEIDKRLTGITETLGGLADSIFDKIKGEGSSDNEGLLEKIGTMIDEKVKNVPSGGSGNGEGTKERIPKIRIFS